MDAGVQGCEFPRGAWEQVNRYFSERFGQNRLMLAATAMVFAHPATGEMLHLQAELEDSFLRVLSVFST